MAKPLRTKLKLARKQCEGLVKIGRRDMKCGDVWRQVITQGRKRVVTCYSHGHEATL